MSESVRKKYSPEGYRRWLDNGGLAAGTRHERVGNVGAVGRTSRIRDGLCQVTAFGFDPSSLSGPLEPFPLLCFERRSVLLRSESCLVRYCQMLWTGRPSLTRQLRPRTPSPTSPSARRAAITGLLTRAQAPCRASPTPGLRTRGCRSCRSGSPTSGGSSGNPHRSTLDPLLASRCRDPPTKSES
jgi:hypothetical protein